VRKLNAKTIRQMQEAFTRVKGRIEGHMHNRFHYLHGDARDEAVAEGLAFAWDNYRKLWLEGRDPDQLLGGIAAFSALRVLRGDRLTGRDPVEDAMSNNPGKRCSVQSIPHGEDEPIAHEVVRALTSKGTSPPDQGAFNLAAVMWSTT
jgi:hypothetical protein